MAIEKEHKSEIENIISRLTAAGVQADEKEKQEIYTRFRLLVDDRLKAAGVQLDEKEMQEIEHKFSQLVDEYRVQSAEAIRTVTQAMFKKHGIATKLGWGWREGACSRDCL